MLAVIGIIFLIIFLGWPAIFSESVPPSSSLARPAYLHQFGPRQVNQAPISVNAISAIAFDKQSGARLFEQNPDQRRSIASLTKLMTALVFLDHNPGWNEVVTITKEDLQSGSKANIFAGDQIKLKDLFTAALIASDNTAITALVRTTGLSEEEFVAAMNEKAKVLRLGNAQFTEPTGLDPANQATAVEVAKLAERAFAIPEIHDALALSVFSFDVGFTVSRQVYATNQLLDQELPHGAKIIAGKTGHVDEAGYCFVGEFKTRDSVVITVILGAPTETRRFTETVKVLGWTMGSYLWDNTE